MQIGENTRDDTQRAARWQELRLGYLADAGQLTATALAVARAAVGNGLHDDERRTLRLLAHRLRGSAGFFDFDAIGACAAALEEAVLAGASAAELETAAERLEQQIEASTAALVS